MSPLCISLRELMSLFFGDNHPVRNLLFQKGILGTKATYKIKASNFYILCFSFLIWNYIYVGG